MPRDADVLVILRDVLAADDPDTVVRSTLQAARDLVHADAAFWMTAERDGLRMTALAGVGQPEAHQNTWIPSVLAVPGAEGATLMVHRRRPNHDAPLVHALIAARDPESGQLLSDDEICNELASFMVGGHETISTALAHSLWQLGHHPELQDWVAEEARCLPDRPMTSEDVPALGYTVQVPQEAMRLCPSVPSIPRLVMQDIEVDGHRVVAGTYAFVGVYAMHRDPTLWDDALTFDPDRFSPEMAKGRDRWQYLPFGGGPRSCIGDHFAMLEATLALASIVRRAQIRSLESTFPIETPFTAIAATPNRARVRMRTNP